MYGIGRNYWRHTRMNSLYKKIKSFKGFTCNKRKNIIIITSLFLVKFQKPVWLADCWGGGAGVAIWFACLSTNVYLSMTDSDKLCNFAVSNRRTVHFDRLSCAIHGRCSVIDWVADILCQIVDRNFMCCHWQFLQIG